MRKFSVFFIMLAPLMLSACSDGEEMLSGSIPPVTTTVQVYTGENKFDSYIVEIGKTFKLTNIPSSGSKYFMGCFKDKTASVYDTCYVDYLGQSVVWKASYPNVLYAKYFDDHEKEFGLETKTLYETGEYKLGGDISTVIELDESGAFKLDFGHCYKGYFEKHAEDLYDLNISFEHYEMTASIFWNWCEYRVSSGSKVLDSGSLSAIDQYRSYNETFQISGSELASGDCFISLSLKMPTGNLARVSGAWYRKMKATLKVADIINEETATFEKCGYQNIRYAHNGGFPLSGIGVANNTVNIPNDQTNILLASKYKPTGISVNFLVNGSGAKSGLLENWVNFEVNALDEQGNKVLSKDMKCEINTSKNKQAMRFPITMSYDELAKAKLFQVKSIKGGSLSANAEAFFIYYQGIEVEFPHMYTYSTSEEKIIISKYNFHNVESLEVSAIDEKPIIKLNALAFGFHNELKSVSLANSITSIETSCFQSCSNLQNVVYPNQMTEIPYSCFNGCSSLKEFEVPQSVQTIDSYAFYDCTAFEKLYVNVGTEVISLGGNQFPATTQIYLKGATDEILAQYKAAPGWSTYADNIFLAEAE